MTRMPCSVTDGPASEMDAIEEAREPQEREYDKYRDSIAEDFSSALRAELIAITRLHAIKLRIDSLMKDVCGSLIGKPR